MHTRLDPQALLRDIYNGREIEQLVLDTFLDDCCIVPKNKSLSRGYFGDLKSLLGSAGPLSDITKAAKAAGFASLGNRRGEPYLIHQVAILYSELLCSFQATMSDGAISNTIESLTTAVLLGLYEVC